MPASASREQLIGGCSSPSTSTTDILQAGIAALAVIAVAFAYQRSRFGAIFPFIIS